MDTQSLAPLLDSVGIAVAVILTLFVFSYLLGDNVLYRLAEHIFVGVSVGYAVIAVFYAAVGPKLFIPLGNALSNGDWTRATLLVVYLVMGLLLLTKPSKRLSWLGNLSVAMLLGVGAALAIGGALFGTLLPQVNATSEIGLYTERYGQVFGLFSGILVLVGAAGVLIHFQFGSGGEGRLAGARARVVQVWGGLGRWFIVIALAAILATVFMSRLSLLIGQIQFLIDAVRNVLGG
jgi:predicted membrane channel-forming protein YqfA (hemolysin III family)